MEMTDNRKFWAAAILAILVALPTLAQVEPDPLAGLESFIENTMKIWDVPGVAVAIVKDHEVVFAKGFGVRDLEKGGKVDADTLFAIGSNTKAFTATAIGLLVEDGKMSWDDPVLEYLPDFQMYDAEVTREITVRDLLCHRGGLGTFQGDLATFGSIYDRAENIHHIRYIQPAYDFPNRFRLLEPHVSHRRGDHPPGHRLQLGRVHRPQFFKPLEMNRSSTTFSAWKTTTNVATPHGLDDAKVVPIPHDDVDNMAPAGSINSSANDMAQWLLLQTGNGMYDGVQVVDLAVISETRKPHNLQQVSDSAKEINPWTHFSAYGLGWALSDYRGRLVVSHGGGLNGMISTVAMLPEENLGIVVLTNFDTHGLRQSVVNHVFDAYLGVDDHDWDQLYAEAIQEYLDARQSAKTQRDEARIPDTSPSLSAEDHVGRYTSAIYGDAEITLEDGVLVIDPKAHPEITGSLEHWQFDTYLCSWSDRMWDESLVYFDLDDGRQSVAVQGDRAPGLGRHAGVRLRQTVRVGGE